MPLDASFEPVRQYVENVLLGGRPVTDDENLLLSGLIDSLGVMSLVSFIEEHFGIKIPFQDVVIENFVCLTAMAGYVARRKAKLS